MTLKFKFLMAGVCAMTAGIYSSCSNDLQNPSYLQEANGNIKLVRPADVTAWSGNQILGNNDFTGPSKLGTRTNDAIYDDEDNYFSYDNEVEDNWVDVYQINGGKGPANILNFLKYGIGNNGEAWIDLDENPWVKEKWITHKNTNDSWGIIQIDPFLPNGTTGKDAIDKLNTDFSIKGKTNDEFTFYPVVSGATDQAHKEIGVFYYDIDGKLHKKKVWDSDVQTSLENGKIKGVKITVLKDCTFGLYFSGRTHNANVNDTYYYTLPGLNEPAEGADDSSHDGLTIHAGLVPQEYLPLYTGSLLLVEDWDDFDFDDFMIFTKENLYQNGNVGTGDDFDAPEGPGTGGSTPECPGKVTPGNKCQHGPGSHDNNGYCTECEDENDPCHDPGCPGIIDSENKCEHSKGSHDNNGYCTECEDENDPCHKPGNTDSGTTTPPAPVAKHHDNEVEVNFSINDLHKDDNGANYDVEDLITKLSIHVRHGGDVQVKIPIGPKYFLPTDDLYILKDHSDFVHGSYKEETLEGLTHTISYDVNGSLVTLKIEYVSEENGNGWIVVTTDGINDEVIDYLMETNGDGINFEIYNYFCINEYNEETEEWVRKEDETKNLDIQELYGMLNEETTIEFLYESYPKYYINAFGYEPTSDRTGFTQNEKVNDIVVSIISDQLNTTPGYTYNDRGYHLNGTPYNYVYVLNGEEADEAHPGQAPQTQHPSQDSDDED